MQALVARGWSISEIGRRLGWEPGNFHAMLQRDHVGAATHREVAGAYERMWNAEPPRSTHREKVVYSRAVNYARRRGWLPPLAWDDIETDPTPELDVVEQGRVTGEEVLDDVAFLLEGGESPEQIAAIINRKPATIAKLAERYGHRDIANTFGSLGKRAAA